MKTIYVYRDEYGNLEFSNISIGSIQKLIGIFSDVDLFIKFLLHKNNIDLKCGICKDSHITIQTVRSLTISQIENLFK